jgi:hypothetical protein
MGKDSGIAELYCDSHTEAIYLNSASLIGTDKKKEQNPCGMLES